MKPKKSKQEERRELAKAMEEFLHRGGNVNYVPRGLSGNADNSNLFQNKTAFEPKSTRTPLTEVVKTLEQRKQKEKSKTRRSGSITPKRKLIVDDFGDPIRWVWDEE